MNMNKEVTYNWKSQVLLLIGALLINVMLVSGVKADNTKAESVGGYPPAKEKDIEKQPYRMADLGGVEELTKAINAEEDLKRLKARIEIAALSPEIKKTLEELNELSRRLNEYQLSGGA